MNDLCFKAECCVTENGSNIKVEEENIKIIFSNLEPKKEFVKIKIDGCEIVGNIGKKADYLLQQKTIGQIIIELKGQNIGRAAEQLAETISYVKQRSNLKTVALIVCSKLSSPNINEEKVRLIERFRKTHRITLHIRTSAKYEKVSFESFF